MPLRYRPLVAGAGIEPASAVYETAEVPLFHPAITWSDREDSNLCDLAPKASAWPLRYSRKTSQMVRRGDFGPSPLV